MTLILIKYLTVTLPEIVGHIGMRVNNIESINYF